MHMVECAWCRKEKLTTNEKAVNHKNHFCTIDCKVKWDLAHKPTILAKRRYISNEVTDTIRNVIANYFQQNGKPKFVSKLKFYEEIVEWVGKTDPCLKYDKKYIIGTITVILKRDFGYSCLGGSMRSSTLWLVG